MALKQAYTIMDEGGISTDVTLASAYHQVKAVGIDLIDETAQFTVLIYKNQGARQSGKAPLAMRAFGFDNKPESVRDPQTGEVTIIEHTDFTDRMSVAALDAAGKNPVAEVYDWLKQNALYQGAEDV